MNAPRVRLLTAVGLFLVTVLLLLRTHGAVGIPRDEGYYFDAGEKYWQWFAEMGDNWKKGDLRASFKKPSIDRGFGYNHEHPVLMKVLYGMSWRVLHRCTCPEQRGLRPVVYRERHRTLGLTDEITAFRLPAMLVTGLLVALVFLFVADLAGLPFGIAAGLLTLLQPRMFFHAHLSCFDVPIAAAWFLVAYGWWRALWSWRWGIATGVFYGLMLATKHNAWLLPAAIGLHWIVMRLQAWKTLGARTFLPPLSLLTALTLGPAIFLLHWPWMWIDTRKRFVEYASFHIGHVHYRFEYLGVNYNKPPFPWHFPLGMTALTAPVMLLCLCLAGAAILIRDRRSPRPWLLLPDPATTGTVAASTRNADIVARPGAGLDPCLGAFIAFNILVCVGTFMTTKAPIFGATKHWLTAMPFVAILAALALRWLYQKAVDADLWRTAVVAVRRRVLAAALVVVTLVPCAVEVARSHPDGLSYYNALAGAFAGGADLGMNRQFWGNSTRALLPWLNANVEPGSLVYFHDTNHEAYLTYVRSGLLRRDIRHTSGDEASIRSSKYALIIHERHWGKHEAWIWEAYGTTTPIHVMTRDGVPIISVYKRPWKVPTPKPPRPPG
jgi:hypothetical protein